MTDTATVHKDSAFKAFASMAWTWMADHPTILAITTFVAGFLVG
jgi:hypothetical protein